MCCTTPRGPWPSCLRPTEATPPVQPLTAAIAGRVDSSPGSSPTHKAAARPTGTLTDSTSSCTDRSCSELRPRPAAASSWGDTVDHASLSRHDAEPSTGRVDLAVAILDWFRRQSIPSQTRVHDRPRPPGRTGLAHTARTQLRQPFCRRAGSPHVNATSARSAPIMSDQKAAPRDFFLSAGQYRALTRASGDGPRSPCWTPARTGARSSPG